MDLDLLVIGDTSAGWQEAIAAAEEDRKVGLIAIPLPVQLPRWDLRELPGHLIRGACADWVLSSAENRTTRRPADPGQWREFSSHALTLWQLEVDQYRDQLLAARGRMWTGTPIMTGAHTVVVTPPGSPPFPLRTNQLVIATGTRPHRPSFAVGLSAGLCEAARLLESSELPGEACIVGAGVTGLRAACLLAWWGSRVRVIDGGDTPSMPGDGDATDLLSWAEKLDVAFEFGEDVIGLRQLTGNQKVGLTLESGRQLKSESVWLATGRRGRTEDLKLEHARLSVDDTGRLWCGPQLRTWIPSIRGAGDVVGYASGSAREVVQSLFESPLATATLEDRQPSGGALVSVG